MPGYTMQKTDGGIVSSEDDAKAALFEGKFDTLMISNAVNISSACGKAVGDRRKQVMMYIPKKAEGLISTAKEHYSDFPESFDGGIPSEYYCTIDNSVTRCDDKIVQPINSEEGYGGGVHGRYEHREKH